MCIVNYNDYNNELFVQLGILKLHVIVQHHQLGIFMFKYIINNLPINPPLPIFNYICEVHKHNARIYHLILDPFGPD